MKQILFLLLVSFPLFSALSPLAQSSKEIQTLLGDPELQQILGQGEEIQEITRTERGYVIRAKGKLLWVEKEILEPHGIGPRHFQFHFSPPLLIGD